MIPHNCYLGVAEAVDRRAAKYGGQVRRVNIADTAEVLSAAEGADVVWIESPANPTIDVADLPALGRNLSGQALFVVDNTFATPLLQRPLESGADIVLHSATKLISGHSDVLLGALVTRIDQRAAFRDTGSNPPFGRGGRRGQWRLISRCVGCVRCRSGWRRPKRTAQILAERLVTHRCVRRVRFPGLPADPGHDVARRTMSGFGSLISIELADAKTADAFVDACSLWVFATSLGGVESTLERRRRWPGELPTVPDGLVRLSVGIEHVEDLWADLAQALDQL